MTEASVLPEQREPERPSVGGADIVVGFPTFNHVESIARLLQVAQQAIGQLPSSKAVIVQADGGSTDGTMERAAHASNGTGSLLQTSYPLYPVHKLELSGQVLPGRESAFRSIFSVAQELGAKACCVIEPDAPGLTPGWIRSLLAPIIDFEFDLVTPRYQRHKYDGLLINGVLYPVLRALYGRSVRQPVGSDFSFSAGLMGHLLAQNDWNTETSRHQVDLWLTLRAIRGDMKICQVSLGAWGGVKKGTAPALSSVLADAVGTLFGEIEQTAERWQRVHEAQPVPSFGLRVDIDTEPVPVDVKSLIDGFRLGARNLPEIWGLVLPPANLLELRKMTTQSDDGFRFADALWAQVVYDFAVGYRLRAIGRDHLLGAFTPLYMGWAASFISRVKHARASAVEDEIETLCRAFESEKRYLISRWRWPDRFMP